MISKFSALCNICTKNLKKKTEKCVIIFLMWWSQYFLYSKITVMYDSFASIVNFFLILVVFVINNNFSYILFYFFCLNHKVVLSGSQL